MNTGSPISQALGQLGSDYYADTAAHTGVWSMIYCVSACAFTTLTSDVLPDGTTKVMRGTLTNITLSAGMFIRGSFTAITLASGSVIAYV